MLNKTFIQACLDGEILLEEIEKTDCVIKTKAKMKTRPMTLFLF